MKITICDDSVKDLIKIEELLFQYQKSHARTGFEVEKYKNPLKVMEKILQGELADIYILDILMSEATGIDLGSQIQKSAENKVIIYITSPEEFALDAYEVRAARYLLKPVEQDKFFEAMDYALSYMEVRHDPIYLVKTKQGLVSVSHSKIEYVENASRMLDVHLTDGSQVKSIFIRKCFEEEVGNLVEDKCFMQVHKSFIINMMHVKKLDGNRIVMDSGAIVPVSKKNAVNVKKEYLLFVSQQYR